MKLNNKQIHKALDYCVEQVNNGRIWVCLRFEDYCYREFMSQDQTYNMEKEYQWFSDKVQDFLHIEWIARYPDQGHGTLDAEIVVWGPDGSKTGWKEPAITKQRIKELRLKMIAWLREQYPLD